MPWARSGSPPPARRARILAEMLHATERFTSACAESTRKRVPTSVGWTVHLRLRGEHRARWLDSHTPSGSPPPARRARKTWDFPSPRRWFTSACAESTDPARHVPHGEPVHLRLRGEHSSAVASGAAGGGSPPPARRARPGEQDHHVGRRFTSACAESTGSSSGIWGNTAVHLRLRGEHMVCRKRMAFRSGSPPPARRARAGAGAGGHGHRFTSACAESTPGPRSTRRSRAVHLRLRGEHSSAVVIRASTIGSPPPARRARHVTMRRARWRRFTSACAESTLRLGPGGCGMSVHLRLRGEHRAVRDAERGLDGSPPPARRARK